jgi:tRNA (Thr-GGU) A37 N-methylase
MNTDFLLHPIGVIRSTIKERKQAPKQGSEGAPDVWCNVHPPFAEAVKGLTVGDEVIVITWLRSREARRAESTSAIRPQTAINGCVRHPLARQAKSTGTSSSKN